MTYQRVIPRDLFNEASLLKCLARISILLDETRGHDADLTNDGAAFDIQQSELDGSIYCENVELVACGHLILLRRPLNSREPWPLWACRTGDDQEVEVFDQHGFFADGFKRMIGL